MGERAVEALLSFLTWTRHDLVELKKKEIKKS